MKQGKTLNELAAELTRVQQTAKDFIVPVQKLQMNDEGSLEFVNGETHNFDLNSWSAGQVASYADIPKAYFDRIRSENKPLLAKNVNHALSKVPKSEARMLRTIDGHVRGFLSSSYKRLDAHDLLNEILPVMLESNFKVQSCELTERRLYLKATTDKVQGEIGKGDVVNYGVVVSTSDVGAGALTIEPFINRLVCLNGMILPSTFRVFHKGAKHAEREVMELLSTRTQELNAAATFATARDILTGSMKPEYFEKELNKMRQATEQTIKNFDLQKVVELAMNETAVKGEGIKKSILDALASGNEGAGLTKWGLVNSFTRAAQSEAVDYDTATDLERAGGQILELSQSAWKRIAEVA